jgi:hypothetical protein
VRTSGLHDGRTGGERREKGVGGLSVWVDMRVDDDGRISARRRSRDAQAMRSASSSCRRALELTSFSMQLRWIAVVLHEQMSV